MDQKQQETAKQAGGTLLIYMAFCVAMLGIYAWSVRRSQRTLRESLAELDRLARERAETPVPRPRRATPKANGSATMSE